VDRLPFAAGTTVIGVGDGLTDDFQSWLEILRHMLELRRPHDRILVLNAAVGGQTTTLALGRFLSTLNKRPDWVLCLLGVNDVVRIGSPAGKTLVSVEETARNLSAMRQLAAPTEAHWVWLTPPTVDEERIAADPFLQAFSLSWSNDDLEAVGDVVRRQPDRVVDVQAVFGRPAAEEFLLPDGIHPSLDGHKAIARALVEQLTW
jgi:acyl-CoA thioesterase-1